MNHVSIVNGRTFSAHGHEFGQALNEVQNRLHHEGVVRARISGISVLTGARVDITGDIVGAIRRTNPSDRFLEAMVVQTENRILTVGSRNATREDVAAETLTFF